MYGVPSDEGQEWRWVGPEGWPEENIGSVSTPTFIPDWNWPSAELHFWWRIGESVPRVVELEDESLVLEDSAQIPRIWQAPPNWPEPPKGWHPPIGWEPNPQWGPAPLGWDFWTEDSFAIKQSNYRSKRDQIYRILLNTINEDASRTKLDELEEFALRAKYEFWHASRPYETELDFGVTFKHDTDESIQFQNDYNAYLNAVYAQRDVLLSSLRAGDTPGIPYVESALRSLQYWENFNSSGQALFLSRLRNLVRISRSTDTGKKLIAEMTKLAAIRLKFIYGLTPGSEYFEGTETDWSRAEQLAADVLRNCGFADAEVTEAGSDGGIDVEGSGILAQVKYKSQPVSRPQIQQLVGANTFGLRMAYFSRSGYSSKAVEYANERRIALFRLELPSDVTPENGIAESLLNRYWSLD